MREQVQQITGKTPNPDRLNPLIEGQNASAAAHLDASQTRNEYLKPDETPAGVDPTLANAVQKTQRPPDMIDAPAPYFDINGARGLGLTGGVSNQELMALENGIRLQQYARKRQEYNEALGFNLDNMSFDLQQQGIQLAANIATLSPGQQNFKRSEWLYNINNNPAYSPLAPGISQQEAAGRAKIINAASQFVIGQVNQNSREQQKSQTLANMQKNLAVVGEKINAGLYKDNEAQAFIEGKAALDAAARYMSPLEYQQAAANLQSSIYEGVLESIWNRVKEDGAGGPLDIKALLNKETGETLEDRYKKIAAFSIGYLGGDLGEDETAVVKKKAAALFENAKIKISDYNRGILDEDQKEWLTAIARGESGTAIESIRESGLKHQKTMTEAGSLTTDDAYKTRDYFKAVGEGSEATTQAEKALLDNAVRDLENYEMNAGGTAPDKTLDIYTGKLKDLILAEDKTLDPENLDDVKEAERRARNRALPTLFKAWMKHSGNEKLGFVADYYQEYKDEVTKAAKDAGMEGEEIAAFTNLADNAFMMDVFSVNRKDKKEGGVDLLETIVARNNKESISKLMELHNATIDIKEAGGVKLTPSVTEMYKYEQQSKKALDGLGFTSGLIEASTGTAVENLEFIGSMQTAIAPLAAGLLNQAGMRADKSILPGNNTAQDIKKSQLIQVIKNDDDGSYIVEMPSPVDNKFKDGQPDKVELGVKVFKARIEQNGAIHLDEVSERDLRLKTYGERYVLYDDKMGWNKKTLDGERPISENGELGLTLNERTILTDLGFIPENYTLEKAKEILKTGRPPK
jgi:hypothetical protein